MSRWISRSSLRYARLVVAAAVAALILGVVQLRAAAVDVYPQFGPPTVQVQTEALGLSAAEVEQFVTVPLEQDLLNGVPWLATIHSRSQPGLSAIDLVFDDGTDVQGARQMVQERLTQAHALPNVGSPPVMVPTAATAARVAMVGLSTRTISPVELSVLARWRVRPKLMGVPGVADVSIFGQRDRQLQVRVDPARLKRDNVSLTQVIETTGNALWVSPLTFVEASTPGTGGFVESGNQRLAIQHISPITTPQQLAAVPVQGIAGNKLRLGDVTEVVQDHQPLIGDAVTSSGPGLLLVVQKTPGADTLAVTRGVEKALDEMRPGLGGVSVDTQVYRPASYLETALRTLGLTLAAGLALMLALLVLLGFWRAAVLVLATVPLTIIGTAGLLSTAGAQLTTMTLLGLAVAALVAVDDAVLAGHLASRAEISRGEVAARLLRSRAAVAIAALIVVVAGLPLLALGALPQAFTAPLLLALATGLAVSTLVGLTLTPVLARLLARRSARSAHGATIASGPLGRLVAGIGGRRTTSPRPRRVPALVAVAVLALAGTVAALPQLGRGHILPTPQDRDLLVRLQAAPATSLPEMDRITGRVAGDLRNLAGVSAVGSHVGRAVASDQLVDVNSAEVWLRLADGADRAGTEAAINAQLHAYPGLATHVGDYTGDLLDQAGRGDDLVVRVYGDDLTQLRRQADAVKTALGSVPGVVAPRIDPSVTQPTVDIQVDLAAARKYGLKPGDVRRDATTLTSGLTVGNLYEQAKVFDVVVLGTPAGRASLQALRGIGIDTPDGGQVALGTVASVRLHPEPSAIIHDDVSRSIAVTASIRGRDAGAVSADVRAKVAAMPLPREFHTRVLGQATVQQDQSRWTIALAVGAVLIALLALQALTRRWRRAALLLVLAVAGGAGAVAVAPLAGGITSAGALTGLAAVFALTLRGVLITQAELVDGDVPGHLDLARAVFQRRSVAVLATAFAIVALLVPAAVLGPRAGLELLHPLAVTVLGGLVTSCVVLLLLVPPLLVGAQADRPVRTQAEAPDMPASTADVDSPRPGRPVAPRLPADDATTSATTHGPGNEGNE